MPSAALGQPALLPYNVLPSRLLRISFKSAKSLISIRFFPSKACVSEWKQSLGRDERLLFDEMKEFDVELFTKKRDLINFIKKEIPLNKLIILDKRVELLGSKVGCIYQD